MQQDTVDIQHPNCFGFLHQSQCQMISFGLRYLEKISRKNKQNLNLSKTTTYETSCNSSIDIGDSLQKMRMITELLTIEKEL